MAVLRHEVVARAPMTVQASVEAELLVILKGTRCGIRHCGTGKNLSGRGVSNARCRPPNR